MEKEIKITPPEGYVIDKENSTFECIKFKKKKPTYGEIARELFYRKESFYISDSGYNINGGFVNEGYDNWLYNKTRATSEKQLEKLLAINKLMNVAKYLNGDWKPDWENCEDKYYIAIDENNTLYIFPMDCNNMGSVYFKSKELAQQAIDILGEDTIRLVLSTDW